MAELANLNLNRAQNPLVESVKMLEIKSGETGARITGLRPEMVLACFIISQRYENFGYTCTITSGTNDPHSRGSKHYIGNACDFRTRNVAPNRLTELVDQIKSALGDEYDVVLEDNHLHVEFDPKTGINL